jgi:hypothetical protein
VLCTGDYNAVKTAIQLLRYRKRKSLIIHKSVSSFSFSMYWIIKLHNQRYIAGDGKCSTKPLPKIVSFINAFPDVALIKCGYYKFSKDLSETLSSSYRYLSNGIKSFDFSNLYTTIPQTQL